MVEGHLAAFDVGPALTLLAEAQVLQNRQHGDRERVVDHGDVDFVRGDAGFAERLRRGLLCGAARNVAVAFRILRCFTSTQDPDRGLIDLCFWPDAWSVTERCKKSIDELNQTYGG